MPLGLEVTSAPAAEPVTRAEAKAHLRADGPDEDALVDRLIQAAREWVETNCRKALITQTLRLSLDCFPGGAGVGQWWDTTAFLTGGAAAGRLELPQPPLQSVSSITYVDTQGNTQTLSSALYRVTTAYEPGFVEPIYGTVWPFTLPVSGAVRVTYVAGYGLTGASVPASVKQAILSLVAHWYENREAVGSVGKEVEMTVTSLVSRNRTRVYS